MPEGVSRLDPRVLEAIRETVLEEARKLGVGVDKIILFGSRARGEAVDESDYDILIVLAGRPDWRTLMRLQSRIRVQLFRRLSAEVDVFLVDRARYEERRRLWGSLEYEAATQGVPL